MNRSVTSENLCISDRSTVMNYTAKNKMKNFKKRKVKKVANIDVRGDTIHIQAYIHADIHVYSALQYTPLISLSPVNNGHLDQAPYFTLFPKNTPSFKCHIKSYHGCGHLKRGPLYTCSHGDGLLYAVRDTDIGLGLSVFLSVSFSIYFISCLFYAVDCA